MKADQTFCPKLELKHSRSKQNVIKFSRNLLHLGLSPPGAGREAPEQHSNSDHSVAVSTKDPKPSNANCSFDNDGNKR